MHMKRYLIGGLFTLNTLAGFTQNLKTETDSLIHDGNLTSIGRLPEGTVISLEGRNYREYDGFVLDMEAMMQPNAIQPIGLIPPSLLYNPFENYRSPTTDHPYRFQPNGTVTYGSTAYPGSLGYRGVYGALGINFPGMGPGIPGRLPFGIGPAPTAPTLRSATFRLNNGWRITTYGEYDADGYKVHHPSALPGQNRSFNGAFEMKSENGNFGIRIGVQRY